MTFHETRNCAAHAKEMIAYDARTTRVFIRRNRERLSPSRAASYIRAYEIKILALTLRATANIDFYLSAYLYLPIRCIIASLSLS